MTSERWLIAAALLCASACADFVRGAEALDAGEPPVANDDAGAPSTGDAGTMPSFATSVHPLMASNCEVCHTAGGLAAASAMVLTGDVTHDFGQVQPLVDVSSPAESRLLLKASGQSNHGGGTIFATGSAGYQTLLTWISGGANP
jgi:hypothetical protein